LRAQAIRTLGKIGKAAVPKLQSTLTTSSNRHVLAGVIEALGEIGPDAKPAVKAIQSQLTRSRDPLIQEAAIRALARIQSN
jgi:HEAT repeat protein